MFRYTMVSVISTVVSIAILAGLRRLPGVDRGPEHRLRQRRGHGSLLLPEPPLGLGEDRASHIRREVLPFWALSIAGMLLSILTASEARHLGIRYFDHDHLARTAIV